VLVAQRCGGRDVACAAHHLGEGGTRLGRQRQPRVPEVVEVPERRLRTAPCQGRVSFARHDDLTGTWRTAAHRAFRSEVGLPNGPWAYAPASCNGSSTAANRVPIGSALTPVRVAPPNRRTGGWFGVSMGPDGVTS
jgi:hypothetical protein